MKIRALIRSMQLATPLVAVFLAGMSLVYSCSGGDSGNDDVVAQEEAQDLTPPGTIAAFGGDTAPEGYLLCDGAAVSRGTYADLFAAIGTAWGEGDGSTTFNLPDLRGRFLRGVDDGAGLDPDAVTRTAIATGGNTGDAVGSVQAGAFASHVHDLIVKNQWSGSCGYISSGGCSATAEDVDNPAFNAQASGANETRPVNAYVNYIIKM